MARVQNVNPPEVGPARGFSNATRAAGLMWLGGQTGADSSGHIQNPGDVAAQFRVVVRTVRAALAAAGCQLGDVVKIGREVNG
jgi:enamine deaminase RidA (YjgF/YER057c/UK114 family)